MEVREYIAIGPNCWGKGATTKEAVKAMKRQWPTFLQKDAEYKVWSCPAGSKVGEFGSIAYPPAQGRPPFIVSTGNASSWPATAATPQRY